MSTTPHDLDQPSALNHAWQVYRNAQELIRFADQKVHVSLALSAILVTFSLANLSKARAAGSLAIVVLVLLGLAVAAFFWYALAALFARRDDKTGASVKRLIYFGHIVRFKEAAEYTREFRTLTQADAIDDLTYQIFEVSCIAATKFRNYRYAWTALMAEIVFFIAFAVILAF